MPYTLPTPAAPTPFAGPLLTPWQQMLLARIYGGALNRQMTPYGPVGGLLDTRPGVDLIPHGGAGQDIADILQFRMRQGILGTEGAGKTRMGGGLLGSQWRDPAFIQQYEQSQGLRPGSLTPPSADVTTIAPPAGRQFDFGKYNAKVSDPRMLTPDARAMMNERGRPTPEAYNSAEGWDGSLLIKYAKALMQQNKIRRPFDSKKVSDIYNQLPYDEQRRFNNTMFPEDKWP